MTLTPSPYSSTTVIMTLLNGWSLGLPVEHNHLMDLSAKEKLSISSVPTSFTLLILSSTICHSNAGISTLLRIGRSFCHVSRSHPGTEFTPCLEILLAGVLSPINLRYLSSCSPWTQCGCCHQTLFWHLDQHPQILVAGVLLPAPANSCHNLGT